ncbi:MAG: hypothetical protein ACLFVO_24680 [Chloroflexaceae bacterium]
MSETREPANADSYQTIPRLAGVIASGRAEWNILFQEMWHVVPHFLKKKQKVPRCRRRN